MLLISHRLPNLGLGLELELRGLHEWPRILLRGPSLCKSCVVFNLEVWGGVHLPLNLVKSRVTAWYALGTIGRGHVSIFTKCVAVGDLSTRVLRDCAVLRLLLQGLTHGSRWRVVLGLVHWEPLRILETLALNAGGLDDMSLVLLRFRWRIVQAHYVGAVVRDSYLLPVFWVVDALSTLFHQWRSVVLVGFVFVII